MIYGLYLSSAGARAESLRQDVLANNLANTQSVSFKRQLAVFRQRLAEVREDAHPAWTSMPLLEQLGGGMQMDGTYTDFRQGPLRETGSDMHVAVVGPGFLTVSDGEKSFLTRDGQLEVDSDGYLTAAGRQLLDENGQPIAVDASQPIEIATDGTIRQGKAAVARLQLVGVAEPSRLVRLGENLYEMPPGPPTTTGLGSLRQRFLEDAAVEPVQELVTMIESHRAFEANVNLIRLQDTTLGRLVNDVPRVA